jgi:putative membrane protein
MNANDFLADRRGIEEAIARLEQKSAAEVVCVVATESGRYDRAESILGVALGLVGLAIADATWDAMFPAGGWGGPAPLAAQALGVVLGFVAGVLVANFVHPLRRLLVSQREQDEEVRRAAWAAFTGSRVHETAGRTGVLIYVSLFEHRVVVLLDAGVRAVVPADFAQSLVNEAVEGLKAGRRAEVLAQLVDLVGEALADRLPAREKKPNELPNHVIALHPR